MNQFSANGTLTIWYRNELFSPIVRPHAGAAGPGLLLVHDSGRPHVFGVCQQFLHDEGIDDSFLRLESNPAPLGHDVS